MSCSMWDDIVETECGRESDIRIEATHGARLVATGEAWPSAPQTRFLKGWQPRLCQQVPLQGQV